MKTEKIKSVPLRTCIICRQLKPKSELLRIVLNKGGEVFIDDTHKANGRGAYVCAEKECVEACMKKKMLNKVFKRNLDESVYVELSEDYEKNRRI